MYKHTQQHYNSTYILTITSTSTIETISITTTYIHTYTNFVTICFACTYVMNWLVGKRILSTVSLV